MNRMSSLEDLAVVLGDAGWETLHLFDRDPPMLRVWHPSTPSFGDSITVRTDDAGRPWYWSSLHKPLASCDDAEAAGQAVIATLAPYVPHPSGPT